MSWLLYQCTAYVVSDDSQASCSLVEPKFSNQKHHSHRLITTLNQLLTFPIIINYLSKTHRISLMVFQVVTIQDSFLTKPCLLFLSAPDGPHGNVSAVSLISLF